MNQLASDIFQLFKDIVAEKGLTILMATHDPLSNNYVDKVINLKDGHIMD